MSPSTVSDPVERAAADGPQLHRGEVLRLVEHDVAEARGAVEQVGHLVEQRHVGTASSARHPSCEAGCSHSSIRCSRSVRIAVRRAR